MFDFNSDCAYGPPDLYRNHGTELYSSREHTHLSPLACSLSRSRHRALQPPRRTRTVHRSDHSHTPRPNSHLPWTARNSQHRRERARLRRRRYAGASGQGQGTGQQSAAGGTQLHITGLGFVDLGAKVVFASGDNRTLVNATMSGGEMRGRVIICETPPAPFAGGGEVQLEIALNGDVDPVAAAPLRSFRYTSDAIEQGSGDAGSGSGSGEDDFASGEEEDDDEEDDVVG